MTIQRWTGLMGIVSACLVLGGAAVVPSLPGSKADLYDFELYFWRGHDRILVGACVASLGLALTLCFLAGLSGSLRGRTASPLATVGLIAGTIRIGLTYGALAFLLTGAFRFGSGSQDTARTIADLFAMFVVLSAYPTLISLAAFGLAMLRARAQRLWLGIFTLIIAGTQLLAASTFVQSGPLSPLGVVNVRVMPAVYYAWLLVVSIALLRGTGVVRSADVR